MKKRNFLIPVATLLSALSASDVDASFDNKLLAPAENNVSNSSSSSTANNPFDFVMQQSDHSDVMAYHTSHASHASHRSHSSHYSSR